MITLSNIPSATRSIVVRILLFYLIYYLIKMSYYVELDMLVLCITLMP